VTFILVVLLYILFFLFGLIIPLLLSIFVLFGLLSDLKGAPFVPTSNKNLKEILSLAKLKKGQVFLELGSGDGRVVREAVKKYGVSGIGIDVNPLLILLSKIIARIQNIPNTVFLRLNIFDYNFNKSNVIFLFMLPKTIRKLRAKFLKECKKGTLIISHGFKIEDFEDYLIYKLSREPYPTYFYKL
jgi:hypothetical protein